MYVRLAVLAALSVAGGCAELPPGLAPDPNERTIAIYVPDAAGQPARVELAPAPDNSWRTSPPAPAIPTDSGDRTETPLTLGGDEGAAFRTLVHILATSGALSPNDLAVRLGPPPIADMAGPRARIERLSRPCGEAYGPAGRPEIRPGLCPTSGARHRQWRLTLVGAGLNVADARAALQRAGYRDLGEAPANPNMHPPLPGTESVFIRGAGDPVVALAYLRQGSGSATVDSVFLLWPER